MEGLVAGERSEHDEGAKGNRINRNEGGCYNDSDDGMLELIT